ncbi:FecCD family ABC transporter permease [Marinicrinis lubricantis]|uniref:FecCD family ABC transporter permease n=1 Tax=Marinicrinis lubricantis TaxID=2086470 RepID=A0ABW1INZ9_9BACL
MKNTKTVNPRVWITIFILGVVVVSIISMGIGALYIHPLDILKSLFGQDENNYSYIIMNFRLPRILVAWLAGAGLAVSGAILQGVIRNPLASPDVIGITKGAGLAAVIVILLYPKSPVYVLPIAAFLGAAVVAIALYALAYQKGVKPGTLALVGIALGAMCHAGIQFFMIKFPVEVNAALGWLSGSVWGRGWDHVLVLAPWIILLLPITMLLAMKLDILTLGDEVAKGLGERVERLRRLLLILAVALAGACVAIVGTIGFVGLIAPHIAKQLVGAKHRVVLPLSACVGAICILVADAIGRGLLPPSEIPAGIFTAIIGAPYFFYLLFRKKTS